MPTEVEVIDDNLVVVVSPSEYIVQVDDTQLVVISAGAQGPQGPRGLQGEQGEYANPVTTADIADGAVTLAKLGFDIATQVELDLEAAARTAADSAFTGIFADLYDTPHTWTALQTYEGSAPTELMRFRQTDVGAENNFLRVAIRSGLNGVSLYGQEGTGGNFDLFTYVGGSELDLYGTDGYSGLWTTTGGGELWLGIPNPGYIDAYVDEDVSYLDIKQATAQSVNPFRIWSSAGSVIHAITPTGDIESPVFYGSPHLWEGPHTFERGTGGPLVRFQVTDGGNARLTSENDDVRLDWDGSLGGALAAYVLGGTSPEIDLYDNDGGFFGVWTIGTGSELFMQAPDGQFIDAYVDEFDTYLYLKKSALQSSDLTQWQATTGAPLSRINATGSFQGSASSVNNTFGSPVGISGNVLAVYANSTTSVPLIVKGVASQSGNLTEWHVSDAAIGMRVSANSQQLVINHAGTAAAIDLNGAGSTKATITATAASHVPLVLKGAASQTGDMMAVRDSSDNPLLAVERGGALSVGPRSAANGYLAMIRPTSVLNVTNLMLRAAAAQTVDQQQWQNSAGTALAKVDVGGSFFSVNGYGGTNASAPFLSMTADGGVFYSLSSSVVPLAVQGAVSQSADLFVLRDSAGASVYTINPNGRSTNQNTSVAVRKIVSDVSTHPSVELTNDSSAGGGLMTRNLSYAAAGYAGFYVEHNTSTYAELYTGVASDSAVLWMQGSDGSYVDLESGAVGAYLDMRMTAAQTFDPLNISNSSGSSIFSVDENGQVSRSGSGVYVLAVSHGASAGATRPTGAHFVHWIGSVEPSNAIDGDIWTDTA